MESLWQRQQQHILNRYLLAFFRYDHSLLTILQCRTCRNPIPNDWWQSTRATVVHPPKPKNARGAILPILPSLIPITNSIRMIVECDAPTQQLANRGSETNSTFQSCVIRVFIKQHMSAVPSIHRTFPSGGYGASWALYIRTRSIW